jgi:hypothetical protein
VKAIAKVSKIDGDKNTLKTHSPQQLYHVLFCLFKTNCLFLKHNETAVLRRFCWSNKEREIYYEE